MLSTKLLASSLIISNAVVYSKNSRQIKAECEDKSGAEKGASDLDAIFNSQDGGMPPDPEEIQELLMKAQGRSIRKPPQFARLMMGLKMLTMVEPVDGLKLDFMAPLSQRFQLGGSWNYSNTKASKFELHTALSSLSGANMMNQDEMSFVSTRSDSTGKLEFSGSYFLGKGLSLRSEGFFMDHDIQKSHVSFELMKEFRDSHVAYKFGGGTHSLSMMQTLNSKLMGGFEMYYIPHTKDIHFCYGATLNHDIHQFFAQYMPIARKETLSFGYVGRPSKRLTLFTELKGSMEGFSDTLVGFRVRFLEGMLTGTFSSSFKATSIYKHYVQNLFMLQFSSQVDFQKPEKAATFGVSLSLGGM